MTRRQILVIILHVESTGSSIDMFNDISVGPILYEMDDELLPYPRGFYCQFIEPSDAYMRQRLRLTLIHHWFG